MNALTGLHQEGEAIYNNWKVEQEIQRNTSTPGQPGTQINMAGDALDGPTQKSLDKMHASDVQLGLTSAQDRNRLIDAAAALDAVYQPSTSPQENYYSFYGRGGNASPSKLGSPSSVTIGDPAADGNVTSAEAAPAQPDPVGQMNPAGTANTVADTDQTERDDGTQAINDADASIEDTSRNQDS